MAKTRVIYTCSECGSEHTKWVGQCSDCGAWNSLSEQAAAPKNSRGGRFDGYAGAADGVIQPLAEVTASDVERRTTTMAELDRVLGGGVVPGSVFLVGGQPGIGKSTLLLQMTAALSGKERGLYVTGEESPEQCSGRAKRLGLDTTGVDILAETRLETILANTRSRDPGVLIIDSIQTMYTDQLQSAPGSVSQVRECAAALVRYAKQTGAAVFLVGHVTKSAEIAGPRVLEHAVDAVLFFEGDTGTQYRVLRAFKNRYGAVNELGVFAMTDKGLKEVRNPSAIFLSNHENPTPGTAVMSTMEGTRPMLAEIQALVDESHGGHPRRVTVGTDGSRLSMLLAVLNRHGGVATADQDVFVNVVGGMKISETGGDLALLAALLSSLRDKPLPEKTLIFGEVGLAGEIRPVPNGPDRLKEAAKHGFTRAIVPKLNVSRSMPSGMEVIGVNRLDEALSHFK